MHSGNHVILYYRRALDLDGILPYNQRRTPFHCHSDKVPFQEMPHTYVNSNHTMYIHYILLTGNKVLLHARVVCVSSNNPSYLGNLNADLLQ